MKTKTWIIEVSESGAIKRWPVIGTRSEAKKNADNVCRLLNATTGKDHVVVKVVLA